MVLSSCNSEMLSADDGTATMRDKGAQRQTSPVYFSCCYLHEKVGNYAEISCVFLGKSMISYLCM